MAQHPNSAANGEATTGTPKGVLRRVLANSGKLLGGKAVSAGLGLITIALAVRALGLEVYGALVLIHTYTLLVSRVVNFQSWQAILRYGVPLLRVGRFRLLRGLIRWSAVLDGASAVVAFGVSAAGAWLGGALIGWPAAFTPAAIAYAVTVPFMMTATPMGVLRLFDRFDLLAVRSALEAVVRFVGVLLAAHLGWGLAGFLMVWFAARAATGVALYGWACRELAQRDLLAGPGLTLKRLRTRFRGIGRFVLTTNVNGTLALGIEQLGTLTVGVLMGPGPAGLFHVADRLAQAFSKPLRLVTQAIYPEIAGLVAGGEHARLRRLILRTVAGAGGLGLVAMTVLVLGGGALLELMGGEAARAAYTLLLLLGFASALRIWWQPLEPLLIAAGHPGRALVAQAVTIATYLSTIGPLLGAAGLPGAGWAVVAAVGVGLMVRGVAARSWLYRVR